jgi:hypothetical protein
MGLKSIDDWLRGPLREMFQDTVLQPQARVSSLINQATAQRVYRAHQAGTGRHGSILWSMLILARWAERYLSPSTSFATNCV